MSQNKWDFFLSQFPCKLMLLIPNFDLMLLPAWHMIIPSVNPFLFIQDKITTKSSYSGASCDSIPLHHLLFYYIFNTCLSSECVFSTEQNVLVWKLAASEFFFRLHRWICSLFSTWHALLRCLYFCASRGHGSSDVMRIAAASGERQPCSQFKCCRAPGDGRSRSKCLSMSEAGQAVLLVDEWK